jgi:hypothetical protein
MLTSFRPWIHGLTAFAHQPSSVSLNIAGFAKSAMKPTPLAPLGEAEGRTQKTENRIQNSKFKIP